MINDFFHLALEFYRRPLDFRDLKDARCPLPAAIDSLEEALECILSRNKAITVARNFAVSTEVLQEAVYFFLRQVLFAQGGDYYRVLGVREDTSPRRVKAHYRLLIKAFHPDTNLSSTEEVESYAVRLNVAYGVLHRGVSDRSLARLDHEESDVRRKVASGIHGQRIHSPANRGSADVFIPRNPWRRAGFYRLFVKWVVISVVIGTVGFIWMFTRPSPTLRVSDTTQSIPDRREMGSELILSTPSSRMASSASHIQEQVKGPQPTQWEKSDEIPPKASYPKGKTTQMPKSDSLMVGRQQQPQQGQASEPLRLLVESPGQTGAGGPEGGLREDVVRKPPGNNAKTFAVNAKEVIRQSGQAQSITLSRDISAEETSIKGAFYQDSLSRIVAENITTRQSADESKMSMPQRVFDKKPVKTNESRHQSMANPGEQERTLTKLSPVNRPALSMENQRHGNGSASTSQRLYAGVDDSSEPSAFPQPQGRAQIPISKPIADRVPVADSSKAETIRPSSPVHEHNRIVAELERAFIQGDLKSFIQPFSNDCKLTEGSGRDFLRADYARLFANTDQRWLRLAQLHWSSADNGDYLGQGTFETKILTRGTWSYTKGKIRLHLVNRGDTYEIESLFHEVDQYQQESSAP